MKTNIVKNKDPFFKYAIVSICFLERARKQLKCFDDGIPESLFYAALELRMGIEARLFEYIEASRRTKKKSVKPITDFQATKLLKELSKIDPKTADKQTLIFAIEGSGQGTSLEYTPVTKELASDHGKLGEILHFNFFKNKKHWYFKERLKKKNKKESLLDYRDFLYKVAGELEEANRGNLFAPFGFFEFINRLNKK